VKVGALSPRRWAVPLMLAAAMAVPALADAADPSTPAASATSAPQADATAERPRSKKDPFESFNRSVFSFNEALDRAVLKPVAQAYKDVVPEYVRTLIDNVFGNVADAWSTVNQLLQGKIGNTVEMGMRVIVNTGFGFGGLLDIGSEIGLEKKPEDFGQTLGRWGMPSGPYVMLPVLGPVHRARHGGAADRLAGEPFELRGR
jgi:phospholipid-binding lipoprotein MlaA